MLVSVVLGVFVFVTANVAEESDQPCPATWTFNEKSKTCIKAYNDKKRTWKKARDICQSMDGDLVVIKNSQMNDFVQGLLSLKRYWIGSRYNKTTTMMRYLDGAEVTPSYEAWAPRQPNNYRGKQECIEIIRKRGGRWNDRSCRRRNHFVCEKQAVEKKEIGPIEKCDEGGVYYAGDNTCLLYHNDTSLSREQASKVCGKLPHGQLVSIRDEKKDKFISDIILQTNASVYTIWIGLTINQELKTKAWDDGGDLGYGDQEISMDENNTKHETNVCVIKQLDSDNDMWWGVHCQDSQNFVCEYPTH